MYVLGRPSDISSVTTSSGCLSVSASWNSVASDPVCGVVSYDVKIISTDGVVVMMNTTIQTSYNFTGLMPNKNYTVTVAGISDAGVGGISTTSVMASVKGDMCNCNVHIIMFTCSMLLF